MALEIIYMDFPSLVIGSTVSLIILVISYAVYRFGIGEGSFEQAIEDQKRQNIEEELKQKSEKGNKKEKKFKKTWGKKSKEKLDSDVSSDSVQATESKEVTPEIEIIEPKETKLMKQKNKSKSAAGQQSPESSVQEKKKVESPPPAAEKLVQDKKKVAAEVEKSKSEPKVEKKSEPRVEKAKSEPSVEKAVKNDAKVEKVKSEQKVEQPKTQMKIEMKEATVQSNSLPTSQQSAPIHKKKKKEHVEKEAVPMSPSEILSVIKESELEAEEIQNFIDVLLNKQKDSSGWTKRNDALPTTKKNIHEKDQSLHQEQKQTVARVNLREENLALKAKLTNQEKTSQERIERLQLELKNEFDKVKYSEAELIHEKEKSIQMEKSFAEEKVKLLMKISKLEAQLKSGDKSDYDAIKKSRDDLKKIHLLLVEQHTQLVSDKKSLTTQLSDAKHEIEKVNSSNKNLSEEFKALKSSVTSLETAKKSIEEKLKVEQKRYADLEAQGKQFSAQAAKVTQLTAELEKLRSENEELASQLAPTKERVAGDGQEISHQNGELITKPEDMSEKLEEAESLLQEKEKFLVQLNEDLAKQKAKINLLDKEIEIQKQRNNELREKNWKAMDALQTAEKNADERIKEIQKTADQKLKEVEKELTVAKQLSNSSSSSPELSEKLKKVEHDAALTLSNFNSEVEKNRQLSSEIDKLNSSHNLKVAELQKNVEELKSDLVKYQSNTKECLQRLCPSVSIDSSLSFEKWLQSFVQQAEVVINSNQNTEVLQQKEKEYLEKQRYYERILSETEATLTQLQKSAESQENIWQGRLKDKQQELDQVISERDALETEKEAMQSTLQQLSQLQEKLKLLQSTIETSENERLHFEQKYDEVYKNCLNLRDQLENKENQLSELQKESTSLDKLKKEVDELKLKLDKEKQISKDFSSQMIRLNSLVKIGQDALAAEQERVKKLEAQLAAAQASTANGTASAATKTSPITVNEDVLDKK